MSLTPDTPPEAGDGPAVALPPPPLGRRVVVIVVQVALVLAVLGGAGLLAAYLIATPPEAKQKRPSARALLVDVEPASFGPQRAVIIAWGTVRPSRTVVLQPRVGGEIVSVSEELLPGGRFLGGGVLLQIDREDYDLAAARAQLDLEQARFALEQCDLTIEQRQSAVAQAESERRLELGQQAIARREFELLGEDVTEDEKELVLRDPQLRTVEAAKQAAKAALKEAEIAKQIAEATVRQADNSLRQAKLALARTTIRAPFNAVIQSRDVDLGATVSPTTRLATLVGTDEYWVEVSVAVDQLQWIQIPGAAGEEGSPVRISSEAAWGPEKFRMGRVCRLTSDLEDQGRMARLLVTVADPLGLAEANQGQPALLIDSYVRVEIAGREVATAAAVRRGLLHDGDNVWVMNEKDQLEIRPVTIAFRNRQQVLVTGGLKAGERLVATDLAAPVESMPLRLRQAPAPAASPGPQGAPAEGGGERPTQ